MRVGGLDTDVAFSNPSFSTATNSSLVTSSRLQSGEVFRTTTTQSHFYASAGYLGHSTSGSVSGTDGGQSFLEINFDARAQLVDSDGFNSSGTFLVTRTGGGSVSSSFAFRNTVVDHGIYTDLLGGSVGEATGAWSGGGVELDPVAAARTSASVNFTLSDAQVGSFNQLINNTLASVNPHGDNGSVFSSSIQLINGRAYETAVAGVIEQLDFGIVHVGE